MVKQIAILTHLLCWTIISMAQQHKRLAFYVDDNVKDQYWDKGLKSFTRDSPFVKYAARRLVPGDVINIDQIVSRKLKGTEGTVYGVAIAPPAISKLRIPIRNIDVQNSGALKDYERNFLYTVIQTHNTKYKIILTRLEENELWQSIMGNLWIYKDGLRLKVTIDFTTLPLSGFINYIFESSTINSRLELIIPTLFDSTLESLIDPNNAVLKSNFAYYNQDEVGKSRRNFTYNAYSATLNGCNFSYSSLPQEESTWSINDWIYSGVLEKKSDDKTEWSDDTIVIKLKKKNGFLCHSYRYLCYRAFKDFELPVYFDKKNYYTYKITDTMKGRQKKRKCIFLSTLKAIYPYQVKSMKKK